MQVFLYWPKQPTFLCGYYDEEKYWCGDAGGSRRGRGRRRTGSGASSGRARREGEGQTCDEKNAELEREREARKVVMRRRLAA